MKSIFTIAAGLVFLGSVGVTNSQLTNQALRGSSSESPGYTIVLTEPAGAFRLSGPMQVAMTITNVTNHEVFWSANQGSDKESWYSGFRFLLQKDGKEVEPTFFHRKISGRQRSGDPAEVLSKESILLPKPPGPMFKTAIDLKLLYQITEPGRYAFSVDRFAEDGKAIVRSNPISITVER